jgi:hypothetical protein
MVKIQTFFRRHRRPVTVVAVALLGLIACIIVIGFIPFSNAMLKNKAQQLLKESLSGQCTIGKLRVTLWKGVLLNDVSYRSVGPEKNTVNVNCVIPRITISYYLIPLLFKHLIINTIDLENPDVTIDLPEPGERNNKRSEVFSVAAFSRVIATIPYTVLVRKISITNARARIGRRSGDYCAGKGVDFSMKVGLNRELTLDGRFGAAEMMVSGAWKLTHAKASVRVKGTQVSLYDCRAGVYGGELTVKGAADFGTEVIHSLSVSLTDVKLDEWQREGGAGRGELTGKIKASLECDESVLCLDSIKGKGWIKATGVSLRGTSLQKSLVLRLAIPKLETLRFYTIYSDLSIKNSKIYTRKFYGKGDPLDFTADGWADFNGRFDERIDGVFSADFSRSLPEIVRNSLLPVEGSKDKCSFKCTIGGTIDNPQLEVDQRIVKRAVSNVFDAIGKSLGNLFKR